MTTPRHNAEELLEHALWIRNLARQLVGEGPHAEDLVQQTWEAALRRQPDASRSLRPWLARVLRHFAGQASRRNKQRPKLEELGETAHGIPTPEEIVAKGETQALIVQQVLALREPFRSTLILRFYEGQTPSQIARVLGVPAATVRGRLKRAIDELRLRLDETHGGDRQAWMLACLPLAPGKPSTLAEFMMNSVVLKWSVVASALLVFGVNNTSWFGQEQSGGIAKGLQVHVGRENSPSESKDNLPQPTARKQLVAFDQPSTLEAIDPESFGQAQAPSPDGGPTYKLILQSAQEIDPLDLRAELLTAESRQPLMSDHPKAISLHAGPLPWVQFAPPEEPESSANNWFLRVLDTEGYWAGESPIDSIQSTEHAPVTVALQGYGCLQIMVKPHAMADGAHCMVRIEMPSEDPLALPSSIPIMRLRLSLEGSKFMFKYQAPGTYRVVFDSHGYATEELELDVRVGQTTLASVELMQEEVTTLPADLVPQLTARIEGRLDSDSGQYRSGTTVHLRSPEISTTLASKRVTWVESNGTWHAKYAFNQLIEGTYEVSVSSTLDKEPWTDNFQWSAPRTTDAPASGVNFQVHDAVAVADFQFEVLDQATGAPLEPFSVGWNTGRSSTIASGQQSVQVHLQGIPHNVPLTWAIHAPGYATSYGNRSQFRPQQAGLMLATVELQKGWRGRFRVIDAATGEPLPGASLSIDGLTVATTGAQGYSTLWRPAVPVSLRFQHGDKHLDLTKFPSAYPVQRITLK